MKVLLLTLLMMGTLLNSFAQRTVSTNGSKYAMLEYTSSVACQFCPDGDYIAEQIRLNQPKAICAALHITYATITDAMVIADAAAYNSAYTYAGVPQATVNRAVTTYSSTPNPVLANRPDWAAAVNEQLGIASTYDVAMTHTYDTATRAIAITLTAEALTQLTGDYHLNVYVIEDSVTGTGAGYEQKNAYNTQSGHPFFGKGNPIIGYYSMHVVRAMLGGTWGSFAITSPAAHAVTTKTFNYTLPAGFNARNITLVATVAKYNTSVNSREIQNAISAKLTACLQPGNVQISAVSFDAITGKNIISWDTTGIRNVTAYNVYKESTTLGQYNLVASQAAGLIPEVSDPALTGVSKYKMSTVDSCGRERFADSQVIHKPIFLEVDYLTGADVKLRWNRYEGITYTTHNVMRSVNGAPYQSLAQLPNTDTTYNTTMPIGAVSYRVEITNPAAGPQKIYSNSTVVNVGVNSVSSSGKDISLYPNPAGNVFNMTGIALNDKVIITDLTGRALKQWYVSTLDQVFNIADFQQGIYLLQVYNSEGLQKANLKLSHE